jgi:hypothetical protein
LNRQIYPSALFPLRGDISAESGATSVIVQGIQGIPVVAPPIEPAGLDTFFYDSYNNDWFYASPWDIPVGTPLVWEGYGYGSSGISWIAPDTLAFGNGADGDVSGAAAMTALVLFGSASYYGPYNDYDVDYGPSYDQFYTSIFSGATQNWNLILPPNPGTPGQVLTTNGTGVSYWSTIASSGGSVTSFSAGNLSPLFTTSVATATSTPALSFSLSNAAGGTVFGNATASAAAPGYTINPVLGIPGTSTGTIALASSTALGRINGKYTITAPAIAAIPTLTLPTTSNVLAGQFAGDNVLYSNTPVGASAEGTLSLPTLSTQTANFVFAGPTSGGALAPTFRALVAADLPAGTGTVTSFSSGNLSPLFTTSVATPTTTPALSFALNTQAPNVVFAGPVSGGAATPTFRALVSTDIPVPGSTGDVLYNNGGVLGAALTTITAAGSITIPDTQTITWTGSAYPSAGLSQLASDTLAIGDGSHGDVSGAAAMTALVLFGSASYYGPYHDYDVDYGPSYDHFYTSIFSGATQNWNLILPPNPGTNGQVLTTNGTGVTEWESISTLGVPWSALTNASTALTLNNATFSTTFQQQAGDVWTWGLASYTAAVSNSPTLTIAGSYQSGAGTFAEDSWTVINTPTVGTTNGIDALIFTHSGTTGNAYVQVPKLQFASSAPTIDVNANGYNLTFTAQNGISTIGAIKIGPGPGNFGFQGLGANQTTYLEGVATTTSGRPSIAIGASASFVATGAVTQVGLCIGANSGIANGAGSDGFTFNPASGSASFVACEIVPTIEGTSSGNTTALLVNPTYTLTNLTGTNLLLDLQSSSVSKLSVNTSGVVTRVAGNATTKQGVSSTLNTSIKTAQAAALSGTSLVAATPSAGMWRISFVATITTAASAAAVLGGTTGFTITYVNGNGDSVTKTTALSTPLGIGATNSTGDSASGDLYCYASSASAITYSYGYTAGTGTAMQYDIAVYAEFLG